MIEQKRFEYGLQKIYQIIVTPDVRELMREKHVQLKRRQTCDETCRYDDYGTNCTDNKRNIDRRRFEEPNHSRYAQYFAELLDPEG